MRNVARATIALTLCLMLATAAAAEVEILVKAEKEIELISPEGVAVTERVEADRVIPGDEVIYTIAYTNRSEEPAENVRITNPIPEHLIFTQVDESGSAKTAVTYSVDGVHYDAPENLTIVDALGNARRAEATDFTHVRWTILEPLSPGEAGTVGFRAELQ
ncbi:MAG: DUF11 domain-containing protein [Gemmatimonadetes bacterium]|nr:DUF11 domain-containing protein [Gemmatimonadota bacterium]